MPTFKIVYLTVPTFKAFKDSLETSMVLVVVRIENQIQISLGAQRENGHSLWVVVPAES